MGIISDYFLGKKFAIKNRVLTHFLETKDRSSSPVNEVNENGMNIIHHAALSGDTEMLNMLRTSLPTIINNVSNEGKTACDYAVSSNQIDAFIFLWNAGADVTQRSGKNHSAIYNLYTDPTNHNLALEILNFSQVKSKEFAQELKEFKEAELLRGFVVFSKALPECLNDSLCSAEQACLDDTLCSEPEILGETEVY